MSEVYTTSLDILYLVLTIFFSILGILLIIGAYYMVRILRDINNVSTKAKDTIDLLNHYLWQPIKIFMMVLDKMKGFKNRKE